MNKFRENFIELLSEHNLSKRAFAIKIGMPESTIRSQALGCVPTVDNLIKICDYFDCSCDYILGLTEDNNYKNIKKGVKFVLKDFYTRYNAAKLGKSDYSVAKSMGVNNGVIANWNAGKTPSVNHLATLAEVLGTSVDYLVGRSDNK